MAGPKKILKFEEAVKRLEIIVDKLEAGELDLAESIDLFEEGVKLSLFCREELKQSGGKVMRLVKTLSGDLELIDITNDLG